MNLQDGEDGFTRLQASSSVYRFLMGPNKGKKALVLKATDQDYSSSAGLVVKANGFSLHAGVELQRRGAPEARAESIHRQARDQ